MNGDDKIAARVEVLSQRLEDLKDRVMQLEFDKTSAVERRAEFRKTQDLILQRLEKVEVLATQAKGGWKVLMALGAMLGFIVSMLVEFFGGVHK